MPETITADSRDFKVGKLSALGTFLNIESELTGRLCDVAQAAYLAGYGDGIGGGCAGPENGVLKARRHAREVLFPIFSVVTATARKVAATLDDEPPTESTEE